MKWTYFYLYVILDIFSRYVVGWMVAPRESATLAKGLISETYEKQRIGPGQLTLHADRGSSMKIKPVALLLADLGVIKSHSRPHVSDDNPFSESQFKTLKYRPDFPDRFGSIQHGRAFCQDFFPWYNDAHRHSGIGLLTPAVVHYGQADGSATSGSAFSPPPSPPPRALRPGDASARRLPQAVWINPAETKTTSQDAPRSTQRSWTT